MGTAAGREELIVPVQGSVLAFDPDSGEPLWSCKTDIGWYMVPSVVAADGVVYCLGGRSGIAALAIRAGGRGDVTQTHRLWTSVKGSNVSSPVYLDGHLYWAHESASMASCVKAATGEVVYEIARSCRPVLLLGAVGRGGADDVNRDGKNFVLAAKPQFEQLAINDLSDRIVSNASPAWSATACCCGPTIPVLWKKTSNVKWGVVHYFPEKCTEWASGFSHTCLTRHSHDTY